MFAWVASSNNTRGGVFSLSLWERWLLEGNLCIDDPFPKQNAYRRSFPDWWLLQMVLLHAVAAQSRIAVLLRAPKGPDDPYYNVSEPTASVKVVSILHIQYLCDDNNLFCCCRSIFNKTMRVFPLGIVSCWFPVCSLRTSLAFMSTWIRMSYDLIYWAATNFQVTLHLNSITLTIGIIFLLHSICSSLPM